MPRSSARERASMPVVALAALAVVGVGLSLYAGAVDTAVSPRPDRASDATTAETTADRAAAALSPAGIARPGRLSVAHSALPDDLRANLTLRSANETWRSGPSLPRSVADGDRGRRATVPVEVRLAPGRVRTGRLTVVIWR